MKRYLTLILAISLLSGCGGSQQVDEAAVPAETTVTENAAETAKGSEYYLDALDLIETLEYSHIAFGMDLVPEGYEAAKAEYLENAESVDNIHDFEFMTQKYLAVFNDLHTTTELLNRSHERLDINTKARNNHTYYVDENGNITGSYVVSVGGVPIEELYKLTEEYFPVENDYGYDNVHSYALTKEFLEFGGCKKEGDTYKVEFSDRTLDVPLIKNDSEPSTQNAMEIKMIGDVLYADLNKFFDKDQYKTMNESISTDVEEGSLRAGVEELKKGVEGGAKKVIIDLRDNPGGLIQFGQVIARAMNMSLPYGDTYHQNSKLFRERSEFASYASFEDHTIDDYTGSLNSAKKNPDLDLVLLVNSNTTSAAVIFASEVQDGGLGTLIGQPPANSPTFMGGVLYYSLPNTDILVHIPGSYLKRADKDADQKAIIPDIILDDDTDALEYALNEYYK